MTTGDDALGGAEFGQVQAVVGEAMDGETDRVGFFFEDEEQGGAAAVGPFHQQRARRVPESVRPGAL
jgi:hypothetical protein